MVNINRVLLQEGVFKISKEGFDVLTASEENLLLSNTVRPFRIIAAGNGLLESGSVISVPFGFTLSQLPLIFMQSSIDSTINKRLPYYFAGADGRYLECRRFNNRVEFRAQGGGDRYIYYAVAMGQY